MNTERLRRYATLDQERLALRRRVAELAEELRPLEEQILEEIVQEGVPQAKVETPDGRVTVYLERKIWAKCTDEDWPRACAALRDAGLGDFVLERYNTTTFSAYLRELDKAGTPMPEPLVGAIEADERLSIRTRRG